MEYQMVRYDRLNTVVKKAVEHTIKHSMMPESLHKCFPKIYKIQGGPEALETARKQIQKYFHSTCMKQVEHIFNERNIEVKLNELDDVIQSAQQARTEKSRKQIQVDLLSPKALIDASVADAKSDTEKNLAMIYEQLVVDNDSIYQEIVDVASQTRDLSDDLMTWVDEMMGDSEELKNLGDDSQIYSLLERLHD